MLMLFVASSNYALLKQATYTRFCLCMSAFPYITSSSISLLVCSQKEFGGGGVGLPIWPQFDPGKDVADGRKAEFNMLAPGSYKSSRISHGGHLASLHAPLRPPTHSLWPNTHTYSLFSSFLSISLSLSLCFDMTTSPPAMFVSLPAVFSPL